MSEKIEKEIEIKVLSTSIKDSKNMIDVLTKKIEEKKALIEKVKSVKENLSYKKLGFFRVFPRTFILVNLILASLFYPLTTVLSNVPVSTILSYYLSLNIGVALLTELGTIIDYKKTEKFIKENNIDGINKEIESMEEGIKKIEEIYKKDLASLVDLYIGESDKKEKQYNNQDNKTIVEETYENPKTVETPKKLILKKDDNIK